MAGLTPEQKKVAGKIYRIGRKRGASRKELLSAMETGLVESTLRNLKYGDADSQGWRQERAQFYKNPTNLNASINRYFDETKAAGRGKGMSAGELSQTVQRSAFPSRYDERKGQAQDVLKWARRTQGGKQGGGRGGKRGAIPGVTVPTVESKTETVTDSAAFEKQQRRYALGQRLEGGSKLSGGALEGLLKPTGSTPESDLLEGLPKGGKISSLFPSEAPNPADYTRQEATQTEGEFRLKGRKGRRGRRGGKPGGAGGGRQVEAGKDGWQGSKTVIRNARQVADKFGIPISSEKRGTMNTASGGVSDHWEGSKGSYALDIDVPGIDTPQGKKIAKRIARQYGMDYAPGQWNEKTIKVKGRNYRVQLGYGGGLDGHDDHIHIGVKRV